MVNNTAYHILYIWNWHITLLMIDHNKLIYLLVVVTCGIGIVSLSKSGGSGTACSLHNSRRSIDTWRITWLSKPSVLLRIWTAFVMLVSSESANHTGGTDGYVSYDKWKNRTLSNLVIVIEMTFNQCLKYGP